VFPTRDTYVVINLLYVKLATKGFKVSCPSFFRLKLFLARKVRRFADRVAWQRKVAAYVVRTFWILLPHLIAGIGKRLDLFLTCFILAAWRWFWNLHVDMVPSRTECEVGFVRSFFSTTENSLSYSLLPLLAGNWNRNDPVNASILVLQAQPCNYPPYHKMLNGPFCSGRLVSAWLLEWRQFCTLSCFLSMFVF